MPQHTIYLDAETSKKLERLTKKNRTSKSKVLADALNRSYTVKDYQNDWVSLFGAFPDFPAVDEERKNWPR